MDPTTTTVDSATVDAAGAVHNITVTANADMVDYELTDGNTYTEEESPGDATYNFTVTAKATYQIDSVKYKVGTEGGENTLTGEGNVYSIPKSAITDNVTIIIAASKIKYTVTPTVTVDGSAVADFDSNETISFSTTATDGKVDAGSSLTINASLKDAAKATHKISKVAYKVGEAEEVNLTDGWNGTTTITNVDGNVAVTVTVVALESYKVSFGAHTNIAKVTEIKVNGAAAETTELNDDTQGNWEIPAVEGSEVSFKLVAAEPYAVGEVKAGDTVLTPVAGVYTIRSLTADTSVTVDTPLDRTKVGRFTFNMAQGSDRKTAKMIVAVPTSATDNDNTAGTYEAGAEEKLTRLEKILVSFEAVDDYVLGEVKVNGAVVTPIDSTEEGASKQYEVTLAVNTDTVITVATDAKGSAAEKYFALKKNADHLALSDVKADDAVITPAAEGENKGKYPVAAGKKRVTFSLTTSEAYEPIVKAVTKGADGAEDTEADVEAYETTTVSGKTTYSYMILASKLADEYTISEKQAKKAISFTGVDNVDVSIDGRLVDATNAIEYTQGRKLTVKVTAKENATLNKVSYQIDDAAAVTPKIVKNASEFQVTLTGNTVVTVDATGALKALPLKDAKGNAIALVKNAYPVSYDGVYTAEIVEGIAETSVKPSAAELLIGSAKVESATGKGAVVSVKNTGAEVNLANADAAAVSGKKLTLKVTVGEEDNAKIFVYTLQATKAITAATDITVPARASQLTDTVKSYAISTKGEIGRIQVKAEDADVTAGYLAKQPDITGGKLIISAGKVPTPADGVKITVYAGEGDAQITKEVVLKTTALITENTAAPKVTLKNATDLGFTLTVAAKTDKDAVANSLYYKVTATPKTGLTADDKLKADATVMYVPKQGDSQDIKVDLRKDNSVVDGEGKAWEYKVTVSLLHAKTTGTEPTTDELTVAASKEFATPDNKPFATQNPAWEANLKLKKGTTTVYTGQDNVKIATPQFTKTTTYTNIEQANIKDLTYSGNSALTFGVDSDGVILASASAQTAVGKHTVQVTAVSDGTNNMFASKATIVVNVVKGINDLKVSIPTNSLYKAVNKAATLKAAPIYNNDWGGKSKSLQPKTKKVKWDIVKAAASHNDIKDDQPFDSKVTVKNGTVTVAKDYVIKADAEENKFQIRVTVDNDKATIGDASAAYSTAVEITNEGLDLNRLVIVDANNKVLAVSSETKAKTEVPLEASQLLEAEIKVVNAEAEVAVNETYGVATANEISVDNLSYKSSKPKDVSVENGMLTVAKANTKPVLTVTANDGSKATLGIKLNVGFDAAAGELSLMIISQGTGDAVYNPTTASGLTATYEGNAVNAFAAMLMMKDDQNSWGPAPAYTNYDIKITGGKKIAQMIEAGQATGASFSTDKKEVKIELTDKSKATPVKKTIVLTNSKFVESGIKVTAKVIGSLRQKGDSNEQDVKLELTIPEEFAKTLSDTTKTMAVSVEPDWSKVTTKNIEDYNTFNDSLQEKEYKITDYNPATKKATVQLVFENDETYNQKSYAVKVSVGSISTSDSKFSAAAPAVAATIKVEKTKKFTFKPTTSYAIATRDGGAVITGKASIPADDLALTNLTLQNANFSGKANAFMTYFEIKEGKLRLKDGADLKHLLDKNNKNDLTGYLTYTATSKKSYYAYSTGTGTNTVKITVKLNDTKPAAKYTAAQTEMMNKAGETKTVGILANKAAVKIAHAAFDTTGTKTDAAIDTDAAAAAALVTADGAISLKLKEAVAANKRTIKATVYVIPADSYYLGEFVAEKNPTIDTYKKYGATVTITLKMVQPKTMTLDDAKTAVTAWVEEVKDADPAPAWLTAENATKETMKQSILDNAKVAINADNVADFTVAFDTKDGADDFDFQAASEAAAGYANGTLKITLGEADATVAFAFEIPKKEAQPATPTVTSVKIQKDSANVETDSVQAGANQQYTAVVEGSNLTAGTNDTVTWSLGNSYEGSSTISNTGLLSVDASESAGSTLTVVATSTLDSTKSATVTVTVTAAGS